MAPNKMSTELNATNNLEQDMSERELYIRKEELRLKEKELEIEREKTINSNMQETKKSRITLYGTIAAILGALGGFFGVYIQGFQNRTLEEQKFKQNLELEKQKFQTSLIFKAVETSNPEEASRNLLFLVRAGFIEDTDHKIEELAANPSSSPFLSLSSRRSLEGYRISDRDLNDYCKNTLGPRSIARGNTCLAGRKTITIDLSKVCLWRTGSASFIYDPVSASSLCRYGLKETATPETPTP